MFVSTRQDHQIADFVFQGMQMRACASRRYQSPGGRIGRNSDTSSTRSGLVQIVLSKIDTGWSYRRYDLGRHAQELGNRRKKY